MKKYQYKINATYTKNNTEITDVSLFQIIDISNASDDIIKQIYLETFNLVLLSFSLISIEILEITKTN